MLLTAVIDLSGYRHAEYVWYRQEDRGTSAFSKHQRGDGRETMNG